FIDSELARLDGLGRTTDYCSVIDTLAMARRRHPGQRNTLDALCKRYDVDNSQRELHGALLDAEILADVYLRLTGGQTDLSLGVDDDDGHGAGEDATPRRIDREGLIIPVIQPDADELAAHEAWVQRVHDNTGGNCVWLKQSGAS
ncbi:MAG: exonuclease domain-containing protein, partial [Pseudomonadota bacterium]